jgi:DNA invertase Pin-like site-specific DNA recombinase
LDHLNDLMMKKRACILARVSTHHQDPKHQVNALRNYCKANDLQIVKEIKSTVTGNTTNNRRDDLSEVLALAKDASIDKVVVTELSRIGRKPREVQKVLDALTSCQVSVVFTQLGIESLDENGATTLSGNLVIAIHSEIAQYERQQLSERIKSGIEYARSQGKQIGRKAGVTEDVEDFLHKHRKVVKALEQGLSLRQIQKVYGTSLTTTCKIKRAMSLLETQQAA